MPLRYKCVRCAQELLLEEAFCGAGCRCQYCRAYMRVPHRPNAAARPSRPQHPPLSAAVHKLPNLPRPLPESAPARVPTGQPLFRRRTMIAAGVSLAIIMTASTAWTLTRRTTSNNDRLLAINNPPSTAAQVGPAPKGAKPKSRAADLQRSFYGVPVDGQVVAYVVDSDAAIAPYLDRLSFAANFVNQSIKGARKFGVVRPDQPARPSLMGMTQSNNSLAESDTTLSAQLSQVPLDLSHSLVTAASWPADQVFLILAKALSDADIDALTDAAEKSGAKTSVIAVGPAAKQDLSKISDATDGRFIPLTDAKVANWSQRYQAAASDH